jgi:hypothetical protein
MKMKKRRRKKKRTKNSSSSSEEEVKADNGIAHEGQLTSTAQVAQVVMSIEFCQNTEESQKSDARGRWRLRRR